MQRTCECGLAFENVFQLGPHRRFCGYARALKQTQEQTQEQHHTDPPESDRTVPPESDHTDPPESADTDSPESDHTDQSESGPYHPFVLTRRVTGKTSPAWYRSVTDVSFTSPHFNQLFSAAVFDMKQCTCTLYPSPAGCLRLSFSVCPDLCMLTSPK